jgi:hypothetical protein
MACWCGIGEAAEMKLKMAHHFVSSLALRKGWKTASKVAAEMASKMACHFCAVLGLDEGSEDGFKGDC